MIRIEEVIVVEGEHDRRAVLASVIADVVVTRGHALKKELMEQLKTLQKLRGIIIFTDPDFAGRMIRRKLNSEIPEAKNAYLPRQEAEKRGDIGIENAQPQAIVKALTSISTPKKGASTDIELTDLYRLGLSGREDSSNRRQLLCRELSLEFGGGKQILRQIALMGYKEKDLEPVLTRIEKELFQQKLKTGSDLD